MVLRTSQQTEHGPRYFQSQKSIPPLPSRFIRDEKFVRNIPSVYLVRRFFSTRKGIRLGRPVGPTLHLLDQDKDQDGEDPTHYNRFKELKRPKYIYCLDSFDSDSSIPVCHTIHQFVPERRLGS